MNPVLPAIVVLIAAGTPTKPLSTLLELGPALTACFRAPEHSAGSQVTVRFSLTRDGAVLGKPKISFARLVGSLDDQKAFVAAALGGLAACTPLHVTPTLGGAIAGRMLAVRFFGGGPGKSI